MNTRMCLMLIMALAIKTASSDDTCTNRNSQITNTDCCHSPLTNSDVRDSGLITTTCTNSRLQGVLSRQSRFVNCVAENTNAVATLCTNSQFYGIRIKDSTAINTRISGDSCTVSNCIIINGRPANSPDCHIERCDIR